MGKIKAIKIQRIYIYFLTLHGHFKEFMHTYCTKVIPPLSQGQKLLMVFMFANPNLNKKKSNSSLAALGFTM